MPLAPIPQATLADTVEARLRGFIREAQLKPGDPLPSEKALAEQLDVSRNVVREALSRLRMQGLVRARKRRGMVLAQPDLFTGFSRLLETGVLDPETEANLMQLRLVIELGIADVVFARMTDADVDRLQALAQEAEGCMHDRDRHSALDAEFHACLYQITRNRELAAFQALLMPFFQRARQRFTRPRAPVPGGTHGDLVQALRSGTPESFRQAMRLHLRHYWESLDKEMSDE